ncbi:MAG TPA: hypothetical protein DC063_09470 [Arenimonas sp.]|nr:hypothetical protein [Arenimonas sp.]
MPKLGVIVRYNTCSLPHQSGRRYVPQVQDQPDGPGRGARRPGHRLRFRRAAQPAGFGPAGPGAGRPRRSRRRRHPGRQRQRGGPAGRLPAPRRPAAAHGHALRVHGLPHAPPGVLR